MLTRPETPWRDRADRDVLALLLFVASLLAFRAAVDPDLPGHLAYGMVHFETGQLQKSDPYSYTAPGAPWINHEWAFEWLLAAAYTSLGTWGLLLLQGVAWIGAAVLVLRLIRRGTADLPPAALLFTGYVALSLPAISVRPQLTTFVSYALLITWLEGARRGLRRGLLAIPVLLALWTNLHGGFLAGLGVLLAYTTGLVLDGALRRPVHGPAGDAPVDPRTVVMAAAVALAAALATLINPYGAGLHRWLYWSLGVPNQNIGEWRALELDPQGITFLLFVALVVASLLHHGWRRVPLAHALPLAATALLSFQHTRHQPFFVMLACAAAAAPLGGLYRRLARQPRSDISASQQRGLRAVVVALALVALTWRVGVSEVGLRLSSTQQVRWPSGAIEYVDELLRSERAAGLPPRNALVMFDWAQLAIWRWYPQLRVHYDGRHRTVYPLELEHEHFAFLGLDAPGEWSAAIRGRPTDMVLVEAGSVEARRMGSEPGWGLAYRDGVAELFLRDWEEVTVNGPERPAPTSFDTRLSR